MAAPIRANIPGISGFQGQLIPRRQMGLIPDEYIPEAAQKLHFKLSQFNQYGLLYDDCMNEDNPVIAEAVRRLPPDVQDERAFRITKALHCCVTHDVLPKDQWTTWEDHLERGKYLQPYIEEVEKELEEKANWNKL